MSLELDKLWLPPIDEAAELQSTLRRIEENLGAITTQESLSQQGEI